MENDAILIPLFGIVFSIGLPLVVATVFIVLNFRKRVRALELHHAERMAAIERGMEIPPLPLELIEGRPHRYRRSSLLPGLVWLFVGTAVLIAFWNVAEAAALLGLVPAGIGLAYLIYYLVEGRRAESRLLESELSDRATRSTSRGGAVSMRRSAGG